MYLCNADFTNAEKELLDCRKNIPDSDIRFSIICELARSLNFRNMGKNEKAIALCLSSDSLASLYHFDDIRNIIFRNLASIYDNVGDSILAEKSRLRYYDFKDSLSAIANIGEVRNKRFLEELNLKNAELAKISTVQKRQFIILVIAFVSLMLTAMAFVKIFVRNKRLKKQYLEIKERLGSAFIDIGTPPPTPIQAQPIPYPNSPLENQEVEEILCRVRQFMEHSQEIYSEAFTLERLTKAIGINRTYLSKAINEGSGCNFKTMLNSYRIIEACRRFENREEYGGMTIEAVGQSVGFQSRRNFGNAFKKETGMSPSEFLKLSRTREKGGQ